MKTILRCLLIAALFILGIIAIVCTGCSSIHGTKTLPDGSTLKISSHRFCWSSEGIQTTVTDSNGLSFTLSIQKSNPDAETAAAITEAAIKAAKSP